QLEGLKRRLADRRIAMECSDAARAHLARVGYDPVFGARPLKRVVQRDVETPVARLIVAGKLRDGGIVKVGAAGGARRVCAPSAGAPSTHLAMTSLTDRRHLDVPLRARAVPAQPIPVGRFRKGGEAPLRA